MWHKMNINGRDIKMVKKEHTQVFIHNEFIMLGVIHPSNNIQYMHLYAFIRHF